MSGDRNNWADRPDLEDELERPCIRPGTPAAMDREVEMVLIARRLARSLRKHRWRRERVITEEAVQLLDVLAARG